MSVSGVVSGMDWDSMIDEIITNAAKPAQVKVNKKTNLTNKKSLFEEMKVTMNSLQSSLSPLKLPSTYKAKTIDIERIDSNSSYKGVLTATVNADAEVNVWDVTVKQLASAQVNRSKQITASSLASTLSGVTGSTLYINAGGQNIGVEVKSSDTLESLKSRINTTLKTLDNPIHVTASVVDNKLILKSDYTGLGAFTASETINYSSNGVNTLTGFSVSDATRENVKISNGSTTYKYGTDYEIVNGNEIRWKKYDQSNEVALGDTVTVKYTMAAGDKYEKEGTYVTSEAEISGFDMIDNGTLASRLKITDGTNNYTYGKDFTITNNKVVWLEEEESYTNEPDSYTVSYSKDVELTSSISGKKVNPTTTLASECTVHIPISAKFTFTGENNSSATHVQKINTGVDFSGEASVQKEQLTPSYQTSTTPSFRDSFEKEQLENEINRLKTENKMYKEKIKNIEALASKDKKFKRKVICASLLTQKNYEIASLKAKLAELNELREKVRELDVLKAQIRQISSKKFSLKMFKRKEEEIRLLKKRVIELESINRRYQQEIKLLKSNRQSFKERLDNNNINNINNDNNNNINNDNNNNINNDSNNNEVFEKQKEKKWVKGEIIHNSEELKMLTKKINKLNKKKITFNLLYKASAYSDKASLFHQKCDKAQNSLVLIETDKGKRFGGFTSLSWGGNCIKKKDENAFVFSLDKMKTYDSIKGEDAIGCYPEYGPVFFGCQIRIYDNAFTRGGTTFKKGLNYKTEEDYERTGGDRMFNIKDIEVYEVIPQ